MADAQRREPHSYAVPARRKQYSTPLPEGVLVEIKAPRPRTASSRLVLPALLLLLVAASVDFLFRGPLRQTDMGDFISPYTATVRFTQYKNPYTLQHFAEDWHAAGAPAATPLKKGMDAVAYPPSTLLVLAPYVQLSWTTATRLYVALCCLLYVLLVYLLALQVGLSWRDPRRLLFAAFALALSPVQSGVHNANLSIFAFLCCGFALLLAQRHWPVPAALLLTLGIFIKPTVGAPLLLLFFLTRRWKLLSIFAGLSAVLAAILFVHMSRIDPLWKSDYQHSLSLVVSNDGPGSFTGTSSDKFDLLNLQMPLYQVTHSVLFANLGAWLLALGLGVVWLLTMLRKSQFDEPWDWADIAALSLLSLIPIYQRNYNAGILIFAVLWGFQHLHLRLGRLVLLLSCVFLVPGEALLRAKINQRLPSSIPNSYPWNAFVMPHATWTVLLLALLMIAAMRLPLASRDASALSS